VINNFLENAKARVDTARRQAGQNRKTADSEYFGSVIDLSSRRSPKRGWNPSRLKKNARSKTLETKAERLGQFREILLSTVRLALALSDFSRKKFICIGLQYGFL